MKAQGVDEVCLICHGKNISPEVQNALMEFYPKDAAQGYQLGEVRGAFSLRKTIK